MDALFHPLARPRWGNARPARDGRGRGGGVTQHAGQRAAGSPSTHNQALSAIKKAAAQATGAVYTCATPSPRTCCRHAPISARCRSCWAFGRICDDDLPQCAEGGSGRRGQSVGCLGAGAMSDHLPEWVRQAAMGRKRLFAPRDSRHPATYLPALDGRCPLHT